jgi:hypothetical protein
MHPSEDVDMITHLANHNLQILVTEGVQDGVYRDFP